MVALQGELIRWADDQAFFLPILAVSLIQRLDERTAFDGEDPSPSLCLQMNRQDLLRVFISIFVQKLTELGSIMQDPPTLLTHDFTQLHPVDMEPVA